MVRPAQEPSPRQLVKVREDMTLPRSLFAAYLRTNARMFENWE